MKIDEIDKLAAMAAELRALRAFQRSAATRIVVTFDDAQVRVPPDDAPVRITIEHVGCSTSGGRVVIYLDLLDVAAFVEPRVERLVEALRLAGVDDVDDV